MTYHSDPSKGGDALADGAQVIEKSGRPVLLPERLNGLDGLGCGGQELHHIRIRGLLGAGRHEQVLTLSPEDTHTKKKQLAIQVLEVQTSHNFRVCRATRNICYAIEKFLQTRST